MTTSACPPDCSDCAADDGGIAELEAEAEQLLARHNEHCVAEALRDANPCGHGPDDRIAAAQQLGDGESPAGAKAADLRSTTHDRPVIDLRRPRLSVGVVGGVVPCDLREAFGTLPAVLEELPGDGASERLHARPFRCQPRTWGSSRSR